MSSTAYYLYFVDARDAETRRSWQQQQANANAVAEAAALQAIGTKKRHDWQVGEHKGKCVKSNFYVEETAVLCKKNRDFAFRCLYVFGYT